MCMHSGFKRNTKFLIELCNELSLYNLHSPQYKSETQTVWGMILWILSYDMVSKAQSLLLTPPDK